MFSKKYIAILLPALVVLIISLLISGCSNQQRPPTQPQSPPQQSPNQPLPSNPQQPDDNKIITPSDAPKLPGRGFFMGVLPLPKEGQSFDDVHIQASKYAEFVSAWGRPTPFYDFADDLSGSWGQTFVEQYIRGNGMFPLIHISFIGAEWAVKPLPGKSNATLSDPEWRASYIEAMLDIVRASKPLYLSIGNEVNRWYEKYGADENDPDGFQHYVSLYHETYDAVKQISPQTKVFCTFAREIVSENREASLDVLTLFDPQKIDVLVFTSYPYAVQGINRPDDIPGNYYSKAFDYFPPKPFGFSELAWSSMDAFGGEQGQADLLIHVSGRLTTEQGINLHLLGWSWLYDLDENDTVGLIKRDGTEKLAYEVWKQISSSGK